MSMQPGCSIPPLDERVTLLKGMRVWVPLPPALQSNKQWPEVINVKLVNPQEAIVVVDFTHWKNRSVWSLPLSKVRFRGHTDDPLLIAMIKAKEPPLKNAHPTQCESSIRGPSCH